MSDSVAELVRQWLLWDGNAATRAEIEQLHAAGDHDTLRRLLQRRMQFGTAGLRARMGAGNARINDLTVIQTSQGLAAYVLEQHRHHHQQQQQQQQDRRDQDGDAATETPGVVVGYDGRHNSRRFAELVAATMLRRGLRVWLFGAVVPTPWVAYGVRRLGASAGVMITASHNPRYDNGYKVYWRNGAQILAPHDAGIEAAIGANLAPDPDAWLTEKLLERGQDPLQQVTADYLAALRQLPAALAPDQVTCSAGEQQQQESPPGAPAAAAAAAEEPVFVATAMHGVAHRYLTLAFADAGMPPYTPVAEQMEPDGDFPTVEFPNPEEGRSALQLAMRTADAVGAHIILANDPDADRLAVAERLCAPSSPPPSAGGGEKGGASASEWHVFTGNELGALLGWWCWHCYCRRHPADTSPCHLIASTVSSKVLRALAASDTRRRLRFHETLTGFKWMANLADQLEAAGETVVFAYEEAIGFMCGTHVLDKDGISAAVCVARMARHLYSACGVSLYGRLQQLYAALGCHVTNNSYYICHRPDVVQRMFHRLRHWPQTAAEGEGRSAAALAVSDGQQQWHYPAWLRLSDGQFVRVLSVRDLSTGRDSAQQDGRALLPATGGGEMITWTLDGGAVLTLRTSGTEPKIKWYTELCGAPGQPAAGLSSRLAQLVAAMQQHWLQPQLNGLEARPE